MFLGSSFRRCIGRRGLSLGIWHFGAWLVCAFADDLFAGEDDGFFFLLFDDGDGCADFFEERTHCGLRHTVAFACCDDVAFGEELGCFVVFV